jgi:integrase
MPKHALSDVGLRSLVPPAQGQIVYWDRKLPTFGVRISQGGSKTFILKRDGRRITLGRFPVISLQDARDEAKRLLAEFTLGRLHPQSLPYSQAVKLFLADKEKTVRPRTLADYKRMLAVHFPFKGQLTDVTHAHIAQRLERLKRTPSEHNHARTVATIFFNWCMTCRYVTHNPVVGISPYERKRRARILSDGELKSIWHACELDAPSNGRTMDFGFANGVSSPSAPELSAHFATIVRLLILCGQRRSETASIQRSWINLRDNLLTIPSDVAKNGNEHCFPLGTLSASLLSAAMRSTNSDFLFPARTPTEKPFYGWGKAKAALDQLSGVTGWTLHDIRRTFRSNLGKLGIAPHIAERVVNHISARSDMEPTATAASSTVVNHYVTQPVVERLVDSDPLAAANFVTQDDLNVQLLQLSNTLTAKFSTPAITPVPQNVAADGNAIVPYAGANAAANFSNLTAAEIPALNYFPSTSTISTAFGGTGLSNSPTFGQLLLGNGSGGYNLVSTSSLGIVSSGGSNNVSTSSQNIWSALQVFAAGASTSQLSVFGKAYFGGTATTTIDSAGQLTLATLLVLAAARQRWRWDPIRRRAVPALLRWAMALRMEAFRESLWLVARRKAAFPSRTGMLAR